MAQTAPTKGLLQEVQLRMNQGQPVGAGNSPVNHLQGVGYITCTTRLASHLVRQANGVDGADALDS